MNAKRAGVSRSSRRSVIGWISGGVVAALVVTLAVVASGFDSREVPREDPSVWVERMAGQYARVNTETAEIDTVRVAESPSGVVQTDSLGLLLTQGFGRAHTINPAAPSDVHDDGSTDSAVAGAEVEGLDGSGATAEEQGQASTVAATEGNAQQLADGASELRTPEGTRQVVAVADWVLFFTQGGEAYLSRAEKTAPGAQAELSAPSKLDPLASERAAAETDAEQDSAQYLANAAAIDETGRVALYSHAEQSIRWFDAEAQKWVGSAENVPEGVPAKDVQLAIVGDQWVLFDSASSRLWREGSADSLTLETVGVSQLQGSSTETQDTLIADEDGLWRIDRAGVATRVVSAAGTAAQPRYVGGEAIAAWVGTSEARLWTENGGEVALTLDETIEDLSNPEPEIRANGSRSLLVERRTGMIWTVPDGKLIPVEQWSLLDPPKQESGTVVTQDVTEQEPPVAVSDSFGVRAGEPALLPVLLNDFDPNRKDVLTVVADGLGEGLGAEFGTVTTLSDGQGLVVQPTDGAHGTSTFSYRITDGVNVSAPATVTLTVADEAVNTAPQWCPVEGCQRAWPSPELAPGGTLILPILEGWVDPEGDPMMLAAATVVNEEDPLRALVTADGKLALRHTDVNAPAGDSVVRVTLVDSRGESTERDLRVRVRTGAAIEFSAAAATAKVGEPTQLRPLERVTGGSGAFQLVDAVVQLGSLTATANPGTGVVEVQPSAVGNALVNVTVRDTVTEQETTGVIRVTAVETRAAFAMPPLRAFVRALADSTVDVLDAVPGANSRALTVRSATVRDGQLRADVIEHSSVRVSGTTFDGQPGRIGSVDVMIAEGDLTSQGRLTVFQVGDADAGAIAVTDTATVRAESVVDIAVLDNDVAPPGERLVLHPEIGAPGAQGELAFASGSRVRYLAPKEPGVYTLSYTTYGASSPEQSDVGQVRVTVLAAGSNRDPQPATVTVRVAPGEMVKTPIALSGVDPDGDRVRLVSIDAPEDPQLSTSILPRSNSVQVSASVSAQRGTKLVNYTVRDSFGGEADGRLRIVVTDPDTGGGAPVVYSDYVRIVSGATEPATIRPLENDLDPSGGTLKLISVVPNVPGGEDSPEFAKLKKRLDLGDITQGIVRVHSGDELGTVSFKYTVRSSQTKSTTDGLIVVQVSERIGQQAPTITDTVLSVRDRADFETSGVDVVTDRVRWASGDASTLKLSLWGSAQSRYKVNGSSIIGSYRAEGELVPFMLSGTDMTGAETQSFGFLIVPPLDELRLSLRPDASAISVAENKSVDTDLSTLLDLGPGDRIEVEQGSFTTQRQQASCTAVGDTTIRYSAGKEAPWADSCTVRVRLTVQKTYTLLPIPVNIIPDAPVVQLNPLTRTVAPGAQETINLTDMVQWQGGREGDLSKLRWQVSGGAAGFEVTTSGTQVQAVARADAVPGSQGVLTVSVAGSGESQSLLTLRVGEAAVDAPRGGTVSLQCTVGSSCSTPLVGIGGEYDPFSGKSGSGLKLVSVDDAGCQFGRLQASGNSVSVSWPNNRGPGGRCTATFTVKDAQNRTGTGSIEFDAQGVPRAPASIQQLRYGADSVSLSVQLGEAANAHPSVTSVVIDMDGSRVGASCAPSGAVHECTVSGLQMGVKHSFTARAVNAVGESDSTANAAPGWAYRTPKKPSVTVTQTAAESATMASFKVEAATSDPSTGSFRVTVAGQTKTIGLSAAAEFEHLQVGQVGWQVVPISNVEVPAGDTADGEVATGSFDLAGRPVVTLAASPREGATTVDIAVSVNANGGSSVSHGYATASGAFSQYPNCTPTQTNGSSGDYTATGSNRKVMRITACAQNEWGEGEVVKAQVRVGGSLTAPVVSSGMTIATTSTGGEYQLAAAPSVTSIAGLTLEYEVQGVAVGQTFPTWLDPSQYASARVRQCIEVGDCSDWSDIGANVPSTVTIDLAAIPACIAPDANMSTFRQLVSSLAQGASVPSYDASAGVLSFGWSGGYASLTAYTMAVPACAPPDPPGPPDPPDPPAGP